MRRVWLLAPVAVLLAWSLSYAYVEAPFTLGRVVNDSTNIVVMEVVKVNKEKDKNLIYFKKVADLKGKHPKDEIKHNVGTRGFHPREWQTIMKWAEPGKKAIFFYNGGASETCIGGYWYQCYQEGEWWAMTHAEPFMLRTFMGEIDHLAQAVTAIAAGREVVVPCLCDQPNRELYHQRQGKMHMLKASLKLLEYNQKRDFLGWGNDPGNIQEYKTIALLPQSTAGWRFTVDSAEKKQGEKWVQPDFDDKTWRSGSSPIGYGEEEIAKRRGTQVDDKGKHFLFRREFQMPPEMFNEKGVQFQLHVASDDSAVVWLNGKELDRDPEADHEFAYWNRDVEIDAKRLLPGRNVVAVWVKNQPKSSDLYLDLEINAQIPLPKKKIEKK
jgi:hypothetical protein